MTLDDISLKRLEVPDDQQLRARWTEVNYSNGRQIEPANAYEAKDSSGYLAVTVDTKSMVTSVTIKPRWNEHIRPEALPNVLYGTYITAIQRSLAAQRSAGQPQPESTPPSPRNQTGLAELPLDEFINAIRSRLDAVDDEYDSIRREQQAPSAQLDEIQSPAGCLRIQIQGGGPVAISSGSVAVDNLSYMALSKDALQLFARSGLGVEPSEPEAEPVRRPSRRRAADNDDDADYFTNFSVFRDGE